MNYNVEFTSHVLSMVMHVHMQALSVVILMMQVIINLLPIGMINYYVVIEHAYTCSPSVHTL